MRINLYKHNKNTDVAMHIISRRRHRNGIKMRIYWFNIANPKKIYPICSDDIVIKQKDLTNWKRYGTLDYEV